jgi:phage/plasmid-associated DNA primase
MEYAASDPDVLCAALTWLVAGAQAWYARGRMMLPLPDAVEESTRKWRAETDLVMGFMDECAVVDPDGFVPTKTFLDAFNAFLDDRGHRPWNDKTLGGRFGTHDAVKQARIELKRKSVNGKQQRGWTGVRLENVPAKNPFAA